MLTKILIINSSNEKNSLLVQVFNELSQKDVSFILWSSGEWLIKRFGQAPGQNKKIFLGPSLKNNFKALLFLTALPLIGLTVFIRLAALRIKRQADAIICLDLNEKIIASLPAKILGIKIIWLENTNLNYRKTNKLLFFIYKLSSRFAKIITFNDYTRTQLINSGIDRQKIITVPLGAKISRYQENIFNKLAAVKQADFHKKYFTVGIINSLNQKQKIENVFQAIRTCLTVISNIQLIIIGEGEERKNLIWLAKKMEIENVVWLVGEQEQLKKWLDSFDIFLVINDSPELDDCGNVLEAMAAGLPVLAPRNIGLEHFVLENKTGALIESDNSEMLARQIIKLHQDKRLRLNLGKNGQERAEKFFSLNQMVTALKKILNAPNG